MAASTISKSQLWWLADGGRESMRRKMVQEARLLDTESSDDASIHWKWWGRWCQHTLEMVTKMTTSTLAESGWRVHIRGWGAEVPPRSRQDVTFITGIPKMLGSLKAYPITRAFFLKYNTTLPSPAPVQHHFSQGRLIFTPPHKHVTEKLFEHLELLLCHSHLYWTAVVE